MMSEHNRAGDQAKYWMGLAKDTFFFLAIVWQLATTTAEFTRAQSDIAELEAAVKEIESNKASKADMAEKTGTNFRRAGNALSASDNLTTAQADIRERLAALEATR